MASALSAECESVLCQSRISRGPGELKRSSKQRIQGIQGLIMVLSNLRWKWGAKCIILEVTWPITERSLPELSAHSALTAQNAWGTQC